MSVHLLCTDSFPISFQRKCPWDEWPPGGCGQRCFGIFHLLGQTVNFVFEKNIIRYFKDGGNHFLFSTMDAGSWESTRDLNPQLVTHFNLQTLLQSITQHVFYFLQVITCYCLVMSGDNKWKVLSIAQRMDVLRRLDSGQSCRMIAKEVGCGKTQISRIRLERMSEWETGGRPDLKYVKRRKTVYEELSNLVWEWFSTARSKELPVSGKLIQVCWFLTCW